MPNGQVMVIFFQTFRISCGEWVEQVRSLRYGIGDIWNIDKYCTGPPNPTIDQAVRRGGVRSSPRRNATPVQVSWNQTMGPSFLFSMQMSLVYPITIGTWEVQEVDGHTHTKHKNEYVINCNWSYHTSLQPYFATTQPGTVIVIISTSCLDVAVGCCSYFDCLTSSRMPPQPCPQPAHSPG